MPGNSIPLKMAFEREHGNGLRSALLNTEQKVEQSWPAIRTPADQVTFFRELGRYAASNLAALEAVPSESVKESRTRGAGG